jgi:type III pantothenate kinase
MKDPGTRLVLDIGNSRTKCGLFRAGRLTGHAIVPNGDAGRIRDFLRNERPPSVVVGSVAREDHKLMASLGSIAPVHVITGETPSHLVSRYRSQDTLGSDRWANAVSASLLFPRRPVVAISLGTCVTYDVVNREGEYLGGAISPGLYMRTRAMSEFTARLPMVEPPGEPQLVGTTTHECLAAGAHHGLLAELGGMVHRIGQQHPGLAVVLTGGDAPRFSRALENGIFAHPFLTLLGLHALSLPDPTIAAAPAAG